MTSAVTSSFSCDPLVPSSRGADGRFRRDLVLSLLSRLLTPLQYNTSIDIWSVGCILAELLGRRAFFPGSHSMDMIERIVKYCGRPSSFRKVHVLTLFCCPFPPSSSLQLPSCLSCPVLYRPNCSGIALFAHLLTVSSAMTLFPIQNYSDLGPPFLALLRSLPMKPQISLETQFPDADVQTIDLLHCMLQVSNASAVLACLTMMQFESGMRSSATELLAHSYFTGLHDEAEEPVSCEPFFVLVTKHVQVSTEIQGMGTRLNNMSLREIRDVIADISLEGKLVYLT